jgi:hypothetical protein
MPASQQLQKGATQLNYRFLYGSGHPLAPLAPLLFLLHHSVSISIAAASVFHIAGLNQ